MLKESTWSFPIFEVVWLTMIHIGVYFYIPCTSNFIVLPPTIIHYLCSIQLKVSKNITNKHELSNKWKVKHGIVRANRRLPKTLVYCIVKSLSLWIWIIGCQCLINLNTNKFNTLFIFLNSWMSFFITMGIS